VLLECVGANAKANVNANVSAGARLSALKHFCCLGDFNNAALHRWCRWGGMKEGVQGRSPHSFALNAPTIWPQVRHGQIDNWCSALGFAWRGCLTLPVGQTCSFSG